MLDPIFFSWEEMLPVAANGDFVGFSVGLKTLG